MAIRRTLSIVAALALSVAAGSAFAATEPRSPEGLRLALETYDRIPDRAPADVASYRAHWRQEIDREAGQKDALFSRLFWHTDLAEALAVAKREGKPVLSLRLLGRLDEEMSCANSRFFRVALYADESVSTLLRDRYVLHWQTVRDVPMMTIDFADGRQIRRPLTGNSMHLVLDPAGKVIDALPGLYAPTVFEANLREDADLLRRGDSAGARAKLARRAAGVRGALGPINVDAAPVAAKANRLTVSKFRVESRPLAEAGLADGAARAGPLPVVRLGAAARALIAEKSGLSPSDPRFATLVERFESSIAQDTAINESRLRPQIAAILAREPDIAVDELVTRVYRDVFLLPLDDPWNGLNPADTFFALPNNGVTTPSTAAAGPAR